MNGDRIALASLGVSPRADRRPVTSLEERKAYQAAWKILHMRDEISVNELVCPGTRRSRAVDRIAKIIREEME